MITIRPIKEDDCAGFHHVLDVVAREKKYISFTEAPPIEGMKAYVLGNIKINAPHFIAIDGKKIIGWCDAPPFPRETRAHCYHLGMGLLPEYRGKGLGRQLIKTVIQDAIEKGAKRIELTVYENNIRAKKLYANLGFEVEGLQKRMILIDGIYLNAWSMALLID